MSLLVKAGVRTFVLLEDTPSSYSGGAYKGLRVNSGESALELLTREGGLEFIIDGGGSAITTGEHGHLVVPYDCTITEVQLEADQSGSIKVDIWKDTYANFPPTDGDTICGGNEPELSTAQKYSDTTLTGWTTTLSKGDILAYNVDSITTIERCSVVLLVNKT